MLAHTEEEVGCRQEDNSGVRGRRCDAEENLDLPSDHRAEVMQEVATILLLCEEPESEGGRGES